MKLSEALASILAFHEDLYALTRARAQSAVTRDGKYSVVKTQNLLTIKEWSTSRKGKEERVALPEVPDWAEDLDWVPIQLAPPPDPRAKPIITYSVRGQSPNRQVN